MTSRRFDNAPRAIARLQRRLDDLWKQASRKGHGHDSLPLGVLGYAEVTSNVGSITTPAVDLASVAVVVAPNRRVRVMAGWRGIASTVAGDRIRVELVGGGAFEMQQIRKVDATNNENEGGVVAASFTSGGSGISSTYVVRAIRHSGSGTVTITASTEAPIWILLEDIGPA